MKIIYVVFGFFLLCLGNLHATDHSVDPSQSDDREKRRTSSTLTSPATNAVSEKLEDEEENLSETSRTTDKKIQSLEQKKLKQKQMRRKLEQLQLKLKQKRQKLKMKKLMKKRQKEEEESKGKGLVLITPPMNQEQLASFKKPLRRYSILRHRYQVRLENIRRSLEQFGPLQQFLANHRTTEQYITVTGLIAPDGFGDWGHMRDVTDFMSRRYPQYQINFLVACPDEHLKRVECEVQSRPLEENVKLRLFAPDEICKQMWSNKEILRHMLNSKVFMEVSTPDVYKGHCDPCLSDIFSKALTSVEQETYHTIPMGKLALFWWAIKNRPVIRLFEHLLTTSDIHCAYRSYFCNDSVETIESFDPKFPFVDYCYVDYFNRAHVLNIGDLKLDIRSETLVPYNFGIFVRDHDQIENLPKQELYASIEDSFFKRCIENLNLPLDSISIAKCYFQRWIPHNLLSALCNCDLMSSKKGLLLIMNDSRSFHAFNDSSLTPFALKKIGVKSIRRIYANRKKEEEEEELIEVEEENEHGLQVVLLIGRFFSSEDNHKIESMSDFLGFSGDKGFETCVRLKKFPIPDIRVEKRFFFHNFLSHFHNSFPTVTSYFQSMFNRESTALTNYSPTSRMLGEWVKLCDLIKTRYNAFDSLKRITDPLLTMDPNPFERFILSAPHIMGSVTLVNKKLTSIPLPFLSGF